MRGEGEPAKPLEFRMIRARALALIAGLAWALAAGSGRPEAAPARLSTAGSEVTGGFFGRSLALRLRLDRAVAFRVFTLDDPMRLVFDFEGLDAAGFAPEGIALPSAVARLRLGAARPGGTRLILDLARPMALVSAEFIPDATGTTLDARLTRVGAAEFAAAAGAPPGVAGAAVRAEPMTIVLDPGHGGADPGAMRDGVSEKDVALAFAGDLRAALLATGAFRVVLTRDADSFVTLADRVASARAVEAGAFLSLHVNAVPDPTVAGVIAFTRSEAGSSRAASDRATAENRSDAVAGLAVGPTPDPARDLLGEIARRDGAARGDRMARAVASALAPLVGETSQDPLQSANFQVLSAPGIPSVLLELGFLSSDADRANMLDPRWRAAASAAMAEALLAWSRQPADALDMTRN